MRIRPYFEGYVGMENGLGLLPHEYTTPASLWADTYDAELDGEGYVGWCTCPHCRDVSNHYEGPPDCRPKGTHEYECGACGHTSTE